MHEDDDDIIDEEDMDEGEPAPQQPLVIKKKPGRPRKKPAPTDNQVEASLRKRTEDELSELLDGLQFGPNDHKVSVTRISPTVDKYNRNVGGFLRTFTSMVTLEELQEQFGGGAFEIKVYGPNPNGKNGLRTKKIINIAGEPKPLLSEPIDPPQQKDSLGNIDIVQTLLSSKEKDVQRAHEEASRVQELLLARLANNDSGLKEILPIIMGAQEKNKSGVELMLQEMREERRRQEEQAREERMRQDAREREEREERRREREAEERRWREEQQERQRQHERAMEEMRQRQREEQASSNQMLTLAMEMMKSSRADSERQRQEEKDLQKMMFEAQFNMMSSGNKSQVEMMMQAQQLQNTILMDALKEAKTTKKGGLSEVMETVTALKTIKSIMDPEPAEEPVWKQIVNEVKDAVPALGATLASVRQQRALPPAARPAQSSAPQLVVADLDEEPQHNPAPQGQQANQQQQPAEPEIVEDDMRNDFTEFTYPPEGEKDMTAHITCLVKNLDLAVQQDTEAPEILEKVVNKLPSNVLGFIKNFPVDDLIGFIESRVPSDWAIVTPKGTDKLREVFALVNAG